jgi:P4 family phage/plasmid primase-like protien
MNATGTVPHQVKTSTALETALELLSLGYWPIVIHAAGATIKARDGDKIAKGKEPIGSSWGTERRDERWLRNAFKAYRGAGVGICFGPGRAPDGGWLIDLEGDGPKAADSLATLFAGEVLTTVGWSSTRGGHTLFIADERLLEALQRAGAKEEKGIKAGVYKLQDLPDLEWRVGGYKADGKTIKQVQSVVPPTPGTDREPRQWTNPPSAGLADLPAAAYAFLERLAESKRPAVKPIPHVASGKATTPAIERAIAYAKTIDPAVSGQGGHTKTFYAACRIGPGFDLPEDVAFGILRDYFNPRCEPPWSDGELRHKIEDAYRNEKRRGFLLDVPGNPRGSGPPAANGPVPSTNGDGDDGSLDATLAGKPRTDYGNAERLVARHGHNLRYCHPWSKFLRYDGRRWIIDDIGAVHRLAKNAARKVIREASTIDDKDERKAHVAWGFTSESRARIESMLAMAASELGIPILPNEMNRDVWQFNCLNGTLDLRTGSLRGHRREDCITQLCPVPFDPSARCPHWDQTLKLFFGNDEKLIAYFQRLCGYALVGVIRDHIMPIAYGKGSNGKSTILGTLLETFGPDYAMKCPPDMLMAKKNDAHPTDRTDLFGKRLVIAIESDTGRRLNETMVKELTGGDRIRARRMREDNWEFQPTHTLMMGTNHKPTIRGTDRGIWRRLKLIPFAVSVEGDQDDKKMPEKLRQELPGILAWCVRGCLAWQENGLDEPDSVKEATKVYRQEQDVLASFLEEHTVQGPQYRVKCGDLYTRYKQEAESGNEFVLSLTAFGEMMRERGFETHKISVKWYLGLALRDVQPE